VSGSFAVVLREFIVPRFIISAGSRPVLQFTVEIELIILPTAISLSVVSKRTPAFQIPTRNSSVANILSLLRIGES
jgi:hypothetical protein